MKFTFKDWCFIKHCLEVAKNNYVEQMESSKPSDKEYSFYQIFKRQSEQTDELIARIENEVL